MAPARAIPARAKVTQAAPFFARLERDTTVLGMLAEGEVIEVLSRLVDDNGRAKVQHPRGWTPAFAPDGRQILLDLGGGAVRDGENTRLPGAGVRYRCVATGLVPRRGLDQLAAKSAVVLAQGEVVVALELRALSGARRCVRCRAGWLDLLAEDGSPQLERVETGAVWSDEQERVSQWLALAGHAQEDPALGHALCEALRADGIPPERWVQTLAALAPDELASRLAAVQAQTAGGGGGGGGAAAAADPADEAVLLHAAALVGQGEYAAAATAFRELLSKHPTDSEIQRGLREAEKGERLVAGVSPEEMLAEFCPPPDAD
jgi:hypothetical protein